MTCITRDEFLQPRPMPRVKVLVPELGPDSYVWVHGLTALQRERLARKYRENGEGEKFDAALAVAVARDDHGQPVFRTQDIDELMEVASGMLHRIAAAAVDLNYGNIVVGNVAEQAKNSSPATPDGG